MTSSLADEVVSLIPAELRERSGGVLYSGREAWTGASPIYLMGFNPGGSSGPTVIQQASDVLRHENPRSSAYVDERWDRRGRLLPKGRHIHQLRTRHLLSVLGLNPGTVPASNAIFVRSPELAASSTHGRTCAGRSTRKCSNEQVRR